MATRLDLNQLRIAAPCYATWSEMEGDDRVRYCSLCKLNVYNVSSMTSAEAEELIRNTEGRLCARLRLRADGTVITRNCPVGLAAVRHRLALAFAASLAIVTAGFAMIPRPGGPTKEAKRVSEIYEHTKARVQSAIGLQDHGHVMAPLVRRSASRERCRPPTCPICSAS